MASPSINTNRVIEITKGTKTNWRTFISDIIGSASNASYKIVDNPEKITVKSQVYLPMAATTPKYSTNNSWGTGLGEVVNTVGNIANEAVYKIPVVGGFLKSTGIQLTDLLQTGIDIGVNATQGEGASFNPWWLNAPTWENAGQTLKFSYTFKFAMGQFGLWNAKEEVVKPILALAFPSMVRNITNNTMQGPGSRTFDIIKTSFKALINADNYSEDKGGLKNFLDMLLGGAVEAAASDKLYTFQFGTFLTLTDVLILNTDHSFSSEVDTSGMPISGTITLHCATFVPQSLSADKASLLSMRYHI